MENKPEIEKEKIPEKKKKVRFARDPVVIIEE